MKKHILHRILFMMIVWMVSVANVTGQNFYSVYRGSVHEYKIPKAQGNYIYTWQVFTDANLTTQAVSSQVLMTPLGVGRENEIQVKWNTSGDYYLMVSVYTIAGCANRKAWHFVVDQSDDKPTARIAGAPIVTLGSCETQGYVLDGTTSTGGGLVFNWSPSTYLDNAASSAPRFLPGKTTRYLLTVTDSRGQKDTASVLIIVSDAPKAVTDKNVFVDAADNTILLNGSKSTGSSLTFEWTSKDGVILNGGTNPTVQVRGLGKYYLKVKDSFGCMSLDSVNVGLYIQAINDNIETNINKSVNINVLKNDIPLKSINPSTISIVTPPMHGFASVSADSTILYQPDDYYIGQDELVYKVCDYFNNCDNATVLVFINDNPFFIPEAFSPNGDGINDKFEIKGIAKYKSVQIEIFNRWGNIVYQSKNYGEGAGKEGFWDGSSKSGPVPTGTYFYILRLDGKENINGSIYVNR